MSSLRVSGSPPQGARVPWVWGHPCGKPVLPSASRRTQVLELSARGLSKLCSGRKRLVAGGKGRGLGRPPEVQTCRGDKGLATLSSGPCCGVAGRWLRGSGDEKGMLPPAQRSPGAGAGACKHRAGHRGEQGPREICLHGDVSFLTSAPLRALEKGSLWP